MRADVAMPLIMRWSLPSVLYALFRRRFGAHQHVSSDEVAARVLCEGLEAQQLEPTGARCRQALKVQVLRI